MLFVRLFWRLYLDAESNPQQLCTRLMDALVGSDSTPRRLRIRTAINTIRNCKHPVLFHCHLSTCAIVQFLCAMCRTSSWHSSSPVLVTSSPIPQSLVIGSHRKSHLLCSSYWISRSIRPPVLIGSKSQLQCSLLHTPSRRRCAPCCSSAVIPLISVALRTFP